LNGRPTDERAQRITPLRYCADGKQQSDNAAFWAAFFIARAVRWAEPWADVCAPGVVLRRKGALMLISTKCVGFFYSDEFSTPGDFPVGNRIPLN
jgi:hypothetical protein